MKVLALNGVCPNIRNLYHEFSAVDPEGKYCRVDMGFAHRINLLKTCIPLRDGENYNVLKQFFNGPKGMDWIQAKLVEITPYCQEIWKAREEKQEDRARELEQTALNHPAVNELDQILTILEKVAGFREGVLTQEEVDLFKNIDPDLPLTKDIPTGLRVQTYIKDKAVHILPSDEMTMENAEKIVEHMIKQEAIVQQKNQGYSQDELRNMRVHVEEKTTEAWRHRYAVGVTRNVLDAIFVPLEKKWMLLHNENKRTPTTSRGGKMQLNDISVENLIKKKFMADKDQNEMRRRWVTVAASDDKTNEVEYIVKEIAGETLTGEISLPFGERIHYLDWYSKNVDALSAQFACSALENGIDVHINIGNWYLPYTMQLPEFLKRTSLAAQNAPQDQPIQTPTPQEFSMGGN